jgi:hypothetical protein
MRVGFLAVLRATRNPIYNWIPACGLAAQVLAGMTAMAHSSLSSPRKGLLKNPGPPEELRRVLLPGGAGSVTRRSHNLLRAGHNRDFVAVKTCPNTGCPGMGQCLNIGFFNRPLRGNDIVALESRLTQHSWT